MVIHLTQRAGDFIYMLSLPTSAPAPAEVLDYLPDGPDYRSNFIASGPYTPGAYTPDSSLQLVRNPAWQADSDPLRKAYVDEIQITFGMTVDAVMQQLQSNDGDMTYDVTIPPAVLQTLIAQGDEKLVTVASGNTNFIFINSVSDNNNGALKDLRVRQALNYAVDKAAVVQQQGGPAIAKPVHGIFGVGVLGYHEFNLYPTPDDKGDPQKARALLAEAGFPDGITLKMPFRNKGIEPAVAQTIQASMAKAGINLELTPVAPADYYSVHDQPVNTKEGSWDIAPVGWTPDWAGGAARSSSSRSSPMTARTRPTTIPTTTAMKPTRSPSSDQATTPEEVGRLWGQVDELVMADAPVVLLSPASSCSTLRGGAELPALFARRAGRLDQRLAAALARLPERPSRAPVGCAKAFPLAREHAAVAIIEARHLSVDIPTEDGIIHAVHDVSFRVEAGEMFGIAGESGSGKSVLTQAILGLIPQAEVTGELIFEGRNLVGLEQAELQKIRGARIGMIYQDPMSSLHPYYSIGSQIAEMVEAHEQVDRAALRRRVVALLSRVGIADAETRYDHFPHQFSGGMRQRVMIAMALVLNPLLIIADEPTTALDVTLQRQIVDLLDEMRHELGTTVMMITHDLGLLSSVADHVMVMYAGRRMEFGPSGALFAEPSHPYTNGLLASSPSNYEAGTELVPIPGRPPSLLDTPSGCVFAPRCPNAMPVCATPPPLRAYDDGIESLCWLESPAPRRLPLACSAPPDDSGELVVKAEGVRLAYGTRGLFGQQGSGLEVLKGIDLELRRGETLGLVGESGCGKSTLARVLAGLIAMTGGRVSLLGRDLGTLTPQDWREMRRQVQLVFQNPYGALNPRRRVGAIIGDPFRIHGVPPGRTRKGEVQRLMELVGLNPEHFNRFPSEFSGGQRQRIGIARALASIPRSSSMTRAVSALDVSIRRRCSTSCAACNASSASLFISHDLAVVGMSVTRWR